MLNQNIKYSIRRIKNVLVFRYRECRELVIASLSQSLHSRCEIVYVS